MGSGAEGQELWQPAPAKHGPIKQHAPPGDGQGTPGNGCAEKKQQRRHTQTVARTSVAGRGNPAGGSLSSGGAGTEVRGCGRFVSDCRSRVWNCSRNGLA